MVFIAQWDEFAVSSERLFVAAPLKVSIHSMLPQNTLSDLAWYMLRHRRAFVSDTELRTAPLNLRSPITRR